MLFDFFLIIKSNWNSNALFKFIFEFAIKNEYICSLLYNLNYCLLFFPVSFYQCMRGCRLVSFPVKHFSPKILIIFE